ncbi:MAG: FKBP-type peptidyl-prolyl cis-trans isomerase [Lachnospiraceae bacterium]|nr:FKBP-type peptidyl-prolyl cis-trans isomerase [Lachnospiraceae bacterium]
MKKLITAAVTFAMIVSMCACSSSSSAAPESSAQTETASETETGEETASETGEETAEETETETEFDESDPAAYIISYDVNDYVTLGEYKGLTYTLQATEYTEEELADIHNQYAQSMSSYEQITDRAVAEGDTINLDYSGVLAGETEPFQDGTATGDYLEIGSGSIIDGFESGLIGVMPGETVELELTFPEDYLNEEYAGKDVVFTVTVNYIEGELIVPEFDDELVALLSMYGYFDSTLSTVEEFDAYMNTQLASSVDDTQKTELIEELIEQCTFTDEYPQGVYDRYINNFTSYYEQYAAYYGMELEDLLSTMGYDMESFMTDANDYAEAAVKEDIAAYAVFTAEGYDADKFYKEEGLSYLSLWGIESLEVAEEAYPQVMLKAAVSYSKGLDILKEYGTGVEATETETESVVSE